MLLEFGRGLPRGEFGLGENLVGPVSSDAGECCREKLPQAAGVALTGQLAKGLAADPLGRRATAVRECCLNKEGVATVDRRGSRGCGKEFTRHNLPQAGQKPLFTYRYDAVGGWRRNPRLLDRLIEGIGLTAAELAGRHPGGKLGHLAELSGRAR